MHVIVVTIDLGFDLSLKAFAVQLQDVPAGRLVQTLQHMLRLALQFFFAVTPCLTPEHHRVRDDVDGHTTLDHADVGSGLMVDPPKLHPGDSFGSDLDRADPLLGANAGVGL
jgi:hypothetical protein